MRRACGRRGANAGLGGEVGRGGVAGVRRRERGGAARARAWMCVRVVVGRTVLAAPWVVIPHSGGTVVCC